MTPTRDRTNLVVWGVLAVVIGAAVAGFISYLVPGFADLYAGFGESLLRPTRFVLGWWYLLWVMPVAALAVFLMAMRRPVTADAQRRAVALLVTGCALDLVLFGLALFAFYAPVFFMGQPV